MRADRADEVGGVAGAHAAAARAEAAHLVRVRVRVRVGARVRVRVRVRVRGACAMPESVEPSSCIATTSSAGRPPGRYVEIRTGR